MCLAIPGKIIAIEGDESLERFGSVDFGGVVKTTSLACVPEAKVGEYVLVHVGLAISVIDAEQAKIITEFLQFEHDQSQGENNALS